MTTHSDKERLRLVYGLLLSAVIAATGIALAVACVAIYKSGPSPFSRERVGQALLQLLPLMLLCVLGVIGGGVLALVCPIQERKAKGGVPTAKMLERFRDTYVSQAMEAAWQERIKWRRRVWLYATPVGLLSALPFVLHLLDPSHFTTENLNHDVLFACLTALPFVCFLVGICGFLIPYVLEMRDRRLLAEFKAAVASGEAVKRGVTVERKQGKAGLGGIRIALLAVAILFIVLGIWNGGMRDVLEKGIRICTECIGLG